MENKYDIYREDIVYKVGNYSYHLKFDMGGLPEWIECFDLVTKKFSKGEYTQEDILRISEFLKDCMKKGEKEAPDEFLNVFVARNFSSLMQVMFNPNIIGIDISAVVKAIALKEKALKEVKDGKAVGNTKEQTSTG